MVGIYFSGTGNSRYAAELFCKEYDEGAKAFSIEDDNITQVVKNEEMRSGNTRWIASENAG